MDKDEKALQALIDGAPFHRWLGIRVRSTNQDGVELGMPWRSEISGHSERQYVHGGILSALIDLAGYYAVAARRDPPIATVDLHVDFMRAAATTDLHVSAAIVCESRALAWASARVIDSGGNIVARGRGLYRTTT
jgi:uncharacterized protein (TIGR00369 family)